MTFRCNRTQKRTHLHSTHGQTTRDSSTNNKNIQYTCVAHTHTTNETDRDGECVEILNTKIIRN